MRSLTFRRLFLARALPRAARIYDPELRPTWRHPELLSADRAREPHAFRPRMTSRRLCPTRTRAHDRCELERFEIDPANLALLSWNSSISPIGEITVPRAIDSLSGLVREKVALASSTDDLDLIEMMLFRVARRADDFEVRLVEEQTNAPGWERIFDVVDAQQLRGAAPRAERVRFTENLRKFLPSVGVVPLRPRARAATVCSMRGPCPTQRVVRVTAVRAVDPTTNPHLFGLGDEEALTTSTRALPRHPPRPLVLRVTRPPAEQGSFSNDMVRAVRVQALRHRTIVHING